MTTSDAALSDAESADAELSEERYATAIDEADDTTDGAADEQALYAGLDPERETDADLPLFDEDTGTLTMAQRNAMNAVSKERFITEDDQPEIWRTLLAHRRLITSRLHDQYKHLRIYPERGLACASDVPQPTEGRRFVLLGKARRFTREETAVLVYMRQRYDVEMAAGQPVAVVDRREIVDHVLNMQPSWLGDKVAVERRINAALERITANFGLLAAVPGETDRFRIHRAVEVFLGLDDVQRLDAAFRAQYEHGQPDADTGASSDDQALDFDPEEEPGDD
jgi:hypothetical protein